jgi:peptidoglycan glycosyltransferase
MAFSAIERAINRKGMTLMLLVLAGAAGFCLYASYLQNVGADLSAGALVPPAVLLAITVAAVLIARHCGVRVDPVLIAVALALSAVGLTFAARFLPDGYGVSRYLVFSSVSLAALVLVSACVRKCGMSAIIRHKWIFGALAVALPYVAILLGSPYTIGHWVVLGSLTINTDLWTALFAIVFAACVLADGDQVLTSDSEDDDSAFLSSMSGSLPRVLIALIPAITLFVSGAATMALAVFFCIVVMLYVQGGHRALVATLAVSLVALLAFGIATNLHARYRIYCWIDPQVDPNGIGYQTIQSMAALRRGSLLGAGVGLGTPELVPFANSDYLFVTVCEELGLIGAAVVLVLYGLLIAREAGLATQARGEAAALLVVGLTCLTAVDVLLATGSGTALLPFPAAVAPYIVCGKSHLLAIGVRLGLILGLVSPLEAEGEDASGELAYMGIRTRTLACLFGLFLAAVVVRVAVVAIP